MKTSLSIFFIISIVFSFLSFNTANDIIEKPELIDGFDLKNNQVLNKLSKNSAQDLPDFIANLNSILLDDDRKIMILKLNIGLSNQKIKDKFEKQMEQIEFKNLFLKNHINPQKTYSKNNWMLFKLSFNKQIQELTNLISDMENNFKEKKIANKNNE